MIYLISTTLLSTSIFVIFRLFKKYNIDNLQAITVNYLTASLIGYFSYGKDLSISSVISASWFPFVLIIGLLFIGVFFLFALSSQKAGVAITAVSSKMSVVIPAAGGFLLFGDVASPLKILGILAALLAFYLTFRKKGKMLLTYTAFFLPVLLFLGTGTNDLLMKYADNHFVEGDLILLLSVIFSVAFIVGATLLLYKTIVGKIKPDIKSLLSGLVLGLVNFGSTFFLFKSMEYFDSSLMFPIRNTGVVTMSALIGFVFFREELRASNWIGIGLAILAIILIAIG